MALASHADQLRWYHTQANIDARDAYIADLVNNAPPFAADQAARLRVLIRGHTGTAPATQDAPPTQAAA